MEAAQALIDERQGRGLGVEEENVVIPTGLAVESGQTAGRQVGRGELIERGLSTSPCAVRWGLDALRPTRKRGTDHDLSDAQTQLL